MRVPDAVCIAVLDSFDNAICRDVVGELVFPAKFAVYRNEVVRLGRICPERNIVWQSLPLRNFHWVVGTARCAVRTPQRGVPTHHRCSSNFFPRAHASSRAFLSPSRTSGFDGSPERMNPWPAPL